MSILFEVYKKKILQNVSEYSKVEAIANSLKNYFNNTTTQERIKLTHKFLAKSGEIQDIIIDEAKRLGFETEKKRLFKNYKTAALRPDYYLKLSETTGILMEVERGKTVVNNMDLLDIWKCHICEYANYLFLIVPQHRHSGSGKMNATFEKVTKRVDSFFIERNYINVDAVFLFGY